MYEIEIPIPKIEIVILIRHDDREFAKPHVFFILPNRNQIKNFITTNIRNRNSYSWIEFLIIIIASVLVVS